MEKLEKLSLFLAGMFFILSLVITTLSQESGSIFTGKPLNASISQPICIQLSANLSDGIFFTNISCSSNNQQCPITDTTVWNNATWNYVGGADQTGYYVQACSGTTINMTIYQSVCDNLKDGSGNTIFIAYSDSPAKGIGFANSTSQNPAYPPQYGPSGPDSWFVIGGRVDVNNPVYVRYWLNPEPDNIPSGVYNTTYMIKAVEVGTNPGDASC